MEVFGIYGWGAANLSLPPPTNLVIPALCMSFMYKLKIILDVQNKMYKTSCFN
jgi:hypothetical protein